MAHEPHVIVHSDSGLANHVEAGPYHLALDEPASLGGTGSGPGPYAYLLTALGGCTSMTLRMYASRKEWSLEEIEIGLSHRKADPSEFGGVSDGTMKIDVIERAITLSGNLDAEQRARLLEIAGKCPVHRTLESDHVKIITTLKQ